MAKISVYRSTSLGVPTVLVGIATGDFDAVGTADETTRLEYVTRYCAVLGETLATFPTLEGIATSGEVTGEEAAEWAEQYRDERIHAGAEMVAHLADRLYDAAAYCALFAEDGQDADIAAKLTDVRSALLRTIPVY